MSGAPPDSYQALAFDPVYYEETCPWCGGAVSEDSDGFRCDDCEWEEEK